MFKYGIILATICIFATGMLASVDLLTKQKILIQETKDKDDSLKEVMPDAVKFELVKTENNEYYKAYDRQESFLGIVFIAEAKGYSSMISTMVAMTKDGVVTAIKILNQNETPGLGSRIGEVKDDTTIFDFMKGKRPDKTIKPWFTEQFSNKTVDELSSVQTISGATISSQAVKEAVIIKAKEIKEIINNGK